VTRRGAVSVPVGFVSSASGRLVFSDGREDRGRLGVDVVVGAHGSSAFAVDRQDAVDVARRKGNPIRQLNRRTRSASLSASAPTNLQKSALR